MQHRSVIRVLVRCLPFLLSSVCVVSVRCPLSGVRLSAVHCLVSGVRLSDSWSLWAVLRVLGVPADWLGCAAPFRRSVLRPAATPGGRLRFCGSLEGEGGGAAR